MVARFKAEELNKQMDEVMDLLMKYSFKTSDLKSMSSEELTGIQKTLEVIETSKELNVAYAEACDKIEQMEETLKMMDKKLDQILKKVEEES